MLFFAGGVDYMYILKLVTSYIFTTSHVVMRTIKSSQRRVIMTVHVV